MKKNYVLKVSLFVFIACVYCFLYFILFDPDIAGVVNKFKTEKKTVYVFIKIIWFVGFFSLMIWEIRNLKRPRI